MGNQVERDLVHGLNYSSERYLVKTLSHWSIELFFACSVGQDYERSQYCSSRKVLLAGV